jgi:DNA polymerase epsilon subunit 1
MSSRYQRQTTGRGGGRGGGDNNNGGGGDGSGFSASATAAAERSDRARRLRRQRLATLRREDAALDSRFGFDEFDSRAAMAMATKMAKAKVEVDAASSSSSSSSSSSRRGWVFNMVATTLPPAPDEDEDAATAGRHTDDGKFFAADAGGGGDDEDGMGGGSGNERSGVELFLIDEDRRRFKATVVHEPYFYLIPEDRTSSSTSTTLMTTTAAGGGTDDVRAQDAHDLQFHYQELLAALTRTYRPRGLNRAEAVRKMDLDAPNHLGAKSQALGGRPMIKLIFDNVDQLQRVKREVADVLRENGRRRADRGNDDGGFDSSVATYDVATYDDAGGLEDFGSSSSSSRGLLEDPMSSLVDMREHDVPYLVRACIDLELRAGCWYTLTPLSSGGVVPSDRATLPKANPTVLAFDIECTKAPLKFPDAEHDSIFMISYMIDGMGYLLLSRHVVGKDVANFEYTPKPKYPGPFVVVNLPTEEALIRRFLHEFERSNPQIVVTYNGDFFDWPFLERRAAVYGLDLRREIGFYNAAASSEGGGGGGGGGFGGGGSSDAGSEYRGRTAVHLDAFCWVKRDSYLPQGSQGLKAVTKYKLGYDPVEVDPEDMVRYARERPAHMASYSVSDAVATYYLYDKYVHMFIFSLCTIIPMGPEDVLRKGSGE